MNISVNSHYKKKSNAALAQFFLTLHQWPRGSALKTGRRQVPSSIPGRACRPNRSEFFVVFS